MCNGDDNKERNTPNTPTLREVDDDDDDDNESGGTTIAELCRSDAPKAAAPKTAATNRTTKDDERLSSPTALPHSSKSSVVVQISAVDPRHAAILQAAHDGNLAYLQHVQEIELVNEGGHDSTSILTKAVCTSGCSALHWAAGNNQLSVIHYLLSPRQRRSRHRSKNSTLENENQESNSYSSSSSSSTTDASVNPHDGAEPSSADDLLPPLFDNVNVCAIGASKGRTPLHYAARNGCLDTVTSLLADYHAHPNPCAKQNVTPLQMAVWRNQYDVCEYLIRQWNVYHPIHNPQVNDFQCNLAHWACISPFECVGEYGQDLIPLLQYLKDLGVDFHAKQKQGHTTLHKASWLGHLRVVQWLHEQCDMWDDCPDYAGNYCVDLCRMAHTSRHDIVEQYLRHHCSKQVHHWCELLNVSLDDVRIPVCDESYGTTNPNSDFMVNEIAVRKAYLRQVRHVHPDRHSSSKNHFYQLQVAYRNLLQNGGRGTQCNPAHQLPLLLKQHGEDVELSLSALPPPPPPPPPPSATTTSSTEESARSSASHYTDTNMNPPASSSDPSEAHRSSVGESSSSSSEEDDGRFKAQLLTVLMEYGTKGMDVSNIKKKWQQVWGTPFPNNITSPKNVTLSRYLSVRAGDVVCIYKSKQDRKVMIHARHLLPSSNTGATATTSA